MAARQLASRVARAMPARASLSRSLAIARPAPFVSVLDERKWQPMPAVRTMSTRSSLVDHDYSSTDNLFEENQLPKGDHHAKRAHTYFVLGGARFMYATAVRLTVIKFVATMSAAADVLALASLEVELGKVNPGQTITVKWRGKPVFIRNRLQDEIDNVNTVDIASLRDPEADADRVRGDPKWLIVLGICTHLGCVPIAGAGEYGGWFCPCHGSHYDQSGRIRKGPAPLNLEVPPYSFAGDKVVIG